MFDHLAAAYKCVTKILKRFLGNDGKTYVCQNIFLDILMFPRLAGTTEFGQVMQVLNDRLLFLKTPAVSTVLALLHSLC